ncbi:MULTISPECIES: dihydroorotate dehydrogenase electron transfer subunit [Lachnospiraceae]|jgi:dihydroorotate dehydrogenase electron transfer subunit|uniref:Dihydroorotate dehydrogenase electron transfer subunit n=1 Tax=Faecalicatena acetigenes TaxID=2981790 RepID=A0ABT2TE93_9FIRM|nr:MULTISPECIES: dihydroorotate dehydrogenase electron transfer subunit [Lachnospiraceae]MCU6748603.1 dihydroorotate dehydrogenase electron transfer subunit [Faecalicatena acetigenes]SCI53334.1 Dihydrdoorotate oxidase B%2C electron transfer subunit [uncultured Clostridium sp.]
MGKILANEKLSDDFYLIEVEEKNQVKAGQFYMLRGWEEYPVLSRPISVFDADGEKVSFLYKKVGKGTELISRLEPGEMLTLNGPYGNGFPEDVKGKIAMVGGGVGIAPFYYTAKKYREAGTCSQIDIYLGFSGQPVLETDYQNVADHVTIDVGGFITDSVDPLKYDVILTCGPEIMMKVLYEKCVKVGASAPLYVSMENRMACGIGMCKVCTCKTKSGNKTACKDGPVFLGSEVFA